MANLNELKKLIARKVPLVTASGRQRVRERWSAALNGVEDIENVEIAPEVLESLPGLIEAMYLRDSMINPLTLARIPISKLRRQSLGISIADPEVNPFTRMVLDFLSGKATSYEDSILRSFHLNWQPTTLAEFLGLDVAPESELNQPLSMDRLPWQPYDGRAGLERNRDEREARQTEKFGVPESGWHGVCLHGPTSLAVGQHRFTKHCRLATSIREHGYEPLPHIEVQLLASADDWVAVVRDGKHRSTALATMGVEDVVVMLSPRFPVVRRDDVRAWPGVTTGLFTVDEALQVFDRFLAGAPPSGFPDFTVSTDRSRS